MKFKLPTEFELMGQTIKVVKEPKLLDMANCCGQSHYGENTIYIDPSLNTDLLALTFYHELVHFILHSLGHQELNNNEGFIDSVANCFYQSMKSAKY